MAKPIVGTRTQKLATGKAMATYAYYDQIGGVTLTQPSMASSCRCTRPRRPAGAHHQPKDKTGGGILFPGTDGEAG